MDLPLDVLGAILGVGTHALTNWKLGRPSTATMPLYVVYGVMGFYGGHLTRNYLNKQQLRQKVILLDYYEKHREDFPDLEPKKYKDVLQPWYPIRNS